MPVTRDITLPHDGQPLAATLVVGDQPSGAGVLFVHGLGSDRRTNVERAAALTEHTGATCLAIDLRGHGDSSGRLSAMTPRHNLDDVTAGYDALAASPGVAADRVGVCSASYGAYLSVLLAERRRVARLLLRAPALYPDGSLDVPLGQRRAGDRRTSRTFLDRLTALRCPLLLVESERDEVIPPAVIAAYLEAQPRAEHAVLADAGHALTDPAWRAAYQRLLLGFFAGL